MGDWGEEKRPKFLDVFGSLDLFGSVLKRSDAFGCNRMRFGAFGFVWTIPEIFGFLVIFWTILIIFGWILILGAYYYAEIQCLS